MTIAALLVFAALLGSWLLVPAERRHRTSAMPKPQPHTQPQPELAAEAA